MSHRNLGFASLGFAFTLLACLQALQFVSCAHAQNAHAEVYTLRPSDQVRLRVYNEPEISGDYQVDGSGLLAVPLAGSLRASGLTTAQLGRAITSRLAKGGIIRDPRVAVQILSYGPFYVHGEVKRGGEYSYRPGLTIMDAVALAGGFTYRADESKVYVRRAGATIEEVYSSDSPVQIFPGDNVRIPERFF
jgi:polysaccharide export outer membrane protein